jgi:hypothetical protein
MGLKCTSYVAIAGKPDCDGVVFSEESLKRIAEGKPGFVYNPKTKFLVFHGDWEIGIESLPVNKDALLGKAYDNRRSVGSD